MDTAPLDKWVEFHLPQLTFTGSTPNYRYDILMIFFPTHISSSSPYCYIVASSHIIVAASIVGHVLVLMKL
jgi:hypothetical protein